MARGLTEFTVQQAVNFDAFSDWNYEEVDQSDTNAHSAQYITNTNPAKKVVIYDRGAEIDNGDDITITINGETATEKQIIVNGNNLPFTLSGVAITSLSISIPDGDTTASEILAILSFH